MNAAYYCRASVSATTKPPATISPPTAAATTTPSLQSCWLRSSACMVHMEVPTNSQKNLYVMAHGLFSSRKTFLHAYI